MKNIYKYGFSFLLASSMTLLASYPTQEQIKAQAQAHASDLYALYPIFTEFPIIKEGDTTASVGISIGIPVSGNQDWIGIYKKGDDNSWNNVVDWAWVKNNQIGKLEKNIKLHAGAYDIRLFFNNSYKVEKSNNFIVEATETPIETTKNTYNVNETVSVNVQMELSGTQDWVGIFPKGKNNSWNNVIKWNWVNNNGTVSLTKGTNNMPAGEYEARLFYNNEYGADVVAEATYAFKVIGRSNYKSK